VRIDFDDIGLSPNRPRSHSVEGQDPRASLHGPPGHITVPMHTSQVRFS